MFSIIGIITALLKIAGALMDYAERRQMMDAGAAKEVLRLTEGLNGKVKAAVAARDRVAADAAAGGLRDDDGFRRGP